MTVRSGFVFTVALLWSTLPPAVLTQTSENPDSLLLQALRLQRNGQFEAAESKLRELLSISPEYHDARIQFGRLLAWDGRFAEADTQFDSVLFFQPSHVEARFAKAQALAWSGRYRQSANIFLALLEENPRSPGILNELGGVYLAGGAPKTGLQYYEQAYLLAPADPAVLRGLARTHRKLGNESLALYWYRKLLASQPGDPEARSEIQRLAYKSDHEIRILGSYEAFNDKAVSEHTVAQLEYYLTLDENWKPFGHFSAVSKFGGHDFRYGAGAYGTLGQGLGIFFQVLGSPGADVSPTFDAAMELSGGIFPSLEGSGGYRYMRYDSVNVHVTIPGITWYFDDDVWLALRSYFGWVPDLPVSSAGTLTLMVQASPGTMLRFGGFVGNEIFQATSIREVSSLKSSGGHAGFKTRLSEFLAVEAFYQYTSRNQLGNSHLLMLTVSTLF
jgi:YaiO family outer membrane protein